MNSERGKKLWIFLLKRLPWAVFTVFMASLLSFSLLYFAPGDPAKIILSGKLGHQPTEQMVQHFMGRFGLNQPFLVQYSGWLGNLLHGDMGNSLRTGEPVLSEFMARFPATLLLAFSAFSFALLLGISLGVLSAVKPDSWWDHLGNIVATTGAAVPSFWLALVLIFFFSIYLDLLPSFGYGSPVHLILPTIALGTHVVARILRITRQNMLDVFGEDFIHEAYAKGLKKKIVVFRHAFRNALVPIITQAGLDFGYLLGGTVIIEKIFGWPGIGRFFWRSIMARDFPVISGFVLISACIFVFINTLVDISYSIIDPRMRPGGEVK